MSAKHDFWLACGHHLLDRDAAKRLVVTDEFLKVYLARAELVPPPEACPAERRLHAILLNNPRQAVTSSQVAVIADPDAREIGEMMIAWRDHLVRHRTLNRPIWKSCAQYQAATGSYRAVDTGHPAQCAERLRRCVCSAGCRDVFSSQKLCRRQLDHRQG